MTHLVEHMPVSPQHNQVEDKTIPVPHFGVVLPWDNWQRLADHLTDVGVEFVVAPHIRFAGKVGEQATLFFLDPAGNALEFKSFKDPTQLFAK